MCYLPKRHLESKIFVKNPWGLFGLFFWSLGGKDWMAKDDELSLINPCFKRFFLRKVVCSEL